LLGRAGGENFQEQPELRCLVATRLA
jgi:hypothetical protein